MRQHVKNLLSTFCSSTSIHGLVYIVQPTRHRIERIFWLISVVISFILTGLLIRKLILDSQNNPIIIYKDQNVERIEDMNFPSITICPGLIYRTPCLTHLDYPEGNKWLLEDPPRIYGMTMEQLKTVQVTSLVAKDGFLSENYPELDIPMDDYMWYLNEFNQTFSSDSIYNVHRTMFPGRIHRPLPPHKIPHNFQAAYAYKYAITLKYSATQFGPCFTANFPGPEEVYETSTTDPDLYNGNTTELMGFDRTTEYSLNRLFQMRQTEYPVRASLDKLIIRHSHAETLACPWKIMKVLNIFKDVVPETNRSGHEVFFHDPYEVISSSTVHFTWGIEDKMEVKITPELTKIDDSLMDESPEYRNCYLPHERKLKFFKVYNKVNCEHECWAEKTLDACGCVQFFMARNKTTKVCGTFHEKCFRKVEEEFDKSACKCFDPCDNLKFQFVLENTETNRDVFYAGCKVSASFTVDSVYATRRKKSYTAVDFLSFVGGILGLFAGFSFMSGAEVVYYFLVVPLMDLRKRNESRIHPLVEQVKNSKLGSCFRFLKEMLESSSIHSFNMIGADERSWIERLIWLVLFICSMMTCCWMTKDVFDAYRRNNMIIKYASTPLDIRKIPLPALTFLPVQAVEVIWYYRDKLTKTLEEDLYLSEDVATDMEHQVRKTYYDIEPVTFRRPSDIVFVLMTKVKSKRYPVIMHENIWDGRRNMPLAYILTSTYCGRVYNLVEAQKLLNNDTISQDFWYTYESDDSSEYPLTTSYGSDKGLRIDFNIWDRNFDILHDQRFIVHPPDELPVDHAFEGIMMGKIYDIFVTPEVMQLDEELKSLDIGIRNCYFEGERKLKYFKIYTQKNCELECISYVVFNVCTCLPYHYVRGPNDFVCDQFSILNCVEAFSGHKASDFDHLFETHGVCNCLLPCNSVRYSYEVYRSVFNRSKEVHRNVITMRWKESEYFPMVKFQEYKLVDFFSFFGGILGLFAGISVLSIFETFYFLTLRATVDLVRHAKRSIEEVISGVLGGFRQ